MGYLWIQDAEGFAALSLTEAVYSIDARTDGRGSLSVSVGATPNRPAILMQTVVADSTNAWAILSSPDEVEINGVPLPSGIRLLRDRDAIRFDGGRMAFFSAEMAAQVEPFPGNEPVSCVRCYSPIDPGSDAVRCPACGVWHHQISGPEGGRDWECWTRNETCAQCRKQSTDSEAGPTWTPEAL
jgi:hypothetical protein